MLEAVRELKVEKDNLMGAAREQQAQIRQLQEEVARLKSTVGSGSEISALRDEK